MLDSLVAKATQQQRRYLFAALSALLALIVAWFLRRGSTVDGRSRKSIKGNDGALKSRKSSSSRSSSRRKESGKPVVDESLPNLILLMGIPGSGKSTWAKEYVFKCDASYTIVSSDDIRKQLTGDINDQSKNSEVWEVVFNQVTGGLKNRRNIILDATNVRTDLRRVLVRQLPECNRYIKLFPVDKSSAKQRIAKDLAKGVVRSEVPDMIIEKMHASFQESQSVLSDEGWIVK
jgi:predicted kinase